MNDELADERLRRRLEGLLAAVPTAEPARVERSGVMARRPMPLGGLLAVAVLIVVALGVGPRLGAALGIGALPGSGDLGEADWWVDPAFGALDRDATVIHGLLVERACASRQSPEGRIVGPDVIYRPDAIVVTFRVRTIGGTCPSNPRYPVTIRLDEAIGGRALIDGGSGRDALLDPTFVQEPSEDCGPLAVSTDDAKIACMAIVAAAAGDRQPQFATITVSATSACGPGDCTTAESIDIRTWQVHASDRLGSTFSWMCSVQREQARCIQSSAGPMSPPPGDPTPLLGDPRYAACGIAPDRTWMAFLMVQASDFTEHFPGWSKGAEELLVPDPALVVISTGSEFRGGNPMASPEPPALIYEICIAVGPSSGAIVHHYGPTRFDTVVPVIGGPAVPMP